MTSNLYHKRKVDTVFGFDFFLARRTLYKNIKKIPKF